MSRHQLNSNFQGAIAVGNHADIAVWDPDVEFDLDDEFPTHVKHPVHTIFLDHIFKNLYAFNLIYQTSYVCYRSSLR